MTAPTPAARARRALLLPSLDRAPSLASPSAMSADPYALLEDGSAADPAAFREALRADPARMEALEAEPEVAKVVLGDDVDAFQELIKSVSQVRCARRRARGGRAQRASARARSLVVDSGSAVCARCARGRARALLPPAPPPD